MIRHALAYLRTWRPRADPRRLPLRARYLVADARALAVWAGYLLRPYDQLADGRRWWWQAPTPCGWAGVPERERTALLDVIAAALDDLPEVECPRCGATIRARLADQQQPGPTSRFDTTNEAP